MFRYAKALLGSYGENNIADKAAALSYYTIFSIGPLLFVIFGVLGKILNSDTYREKLLNQVQNLAGSKAGSVITDALNNQALTHKAGTAFLIGGVGLVLGAIGIFGQLQKSLDDILHVKVGPDAGFKPIIKQKILSLGLVGVICFLLLVSLLASAAISAVANHFNNNSGADLIFRLVDFITSLIVFALLLTALYRTLPEVKLPWKVLFSTSVVVAVFFSIGKSLLGLIIGHNASITAFGAAGSLIALLLWIFYSGQIIYLGAAGISIYAEKNPVAMIPRYKGERGVMRVKKVEEPLPAAGLKNTLRHKFVEGVKQGLKKK